MAITLADADLHINPLNAKKQQMCRRLIPGAWASIVCKHLCRGRYPSVGARTGVDKPAKGVRGHAAETARWAPRMISRFISALQRSPKCLASETGAFACGITQISAEVRGQSAGGVAICCTDEPANGVGSPLVATNAKAYHGGERGFGGPPGFVSLHSTPAGGTMSVGDSPLTRASLLVQLRDGANQAAWQEFMRVYGPLVYGFARKRGLQDADAADLMQDVLRSVSTAIGRLDYDRSQGTFRGWLFTITRNKIFNFLSARNARPQASGDGRTSQLLDSVPDDGEGADLWELEYQRRLAALAMERIRSEFQGNTWQAFVLTAVEGKPAAEVGRQLGMTSGAVYVAKSRVLARLKEEVESMRRQEEG